jgi:hypothetical protein
VDRVQPHVTLRFLERGHAHKYRFAGGVYRPNPLLSSAHARSSSMQVTPRDVTLGFDAPKSVTINAHRTSSQGHQQSVPRAEVTQW